MMYLSCTSVCWYLYDFNIGIDVCVIMIGELVIIYITHIYKCLVDTSSFVLSMIADTSLWCSDKSFS